MYSMKITVKNKQNKNYVQLSSLNRGGFSLNLHKSSWIYSSSCTVYFKLLSLKTRAIERISAGAKTDTENEEHLGLIWDFNLSHSEI